MKTYLINDLFHTLQGEGFNWGRRALFVRMPGCNLACPWCDTKFDTHVKWAEEDFERFVCEEKTRFAVITGGEPLMNKQTPFILSHLKALGFEIAVETNGTFCLKDAEMESIDFVTCSPKAEASFFVQPKLDMYVSEYKYVVDSKFDFALLKRHKGTEAKFLSLSPEYNEFQKNVDRIIEFIKINPEWRLSLQTHKWIGVP